MRGGGGLPGRCLLQQPQLPLRPTLQAIVSNHRSKLHSAAVAQQSRGQLQPRNFRNNGEAADEHGNSNGSGGGTGGGRERLDGSTGATDENTQSLNGECLAAVLHGCSMHTQCQQLQSAHNLPWGLHVMGLQRCTDSGLFMDQCCSTAGQQPCP